MPKVIRSRCRSRRGAAAVGCRRGNPAGVGGAFGRGTAVLSAVDPGARSARVNFEARETRGLQGQILLAGPFVG
jgi:hypothetical protein